VRWQWADVASKISLYFLLACASGCFTPEADAPPEAGETTSGSTVGATSAESTSSGQSTDASAATGDQPVESSGDTSGGVASSGSDETTSATGETGTPSCGDGTVDDGEECDDGNDEDRDACSNACVAGFHTGSLEPCGDLGETMCGYFEADCRVDPDGEPPSLCHWPEASTQDACDGTPGRWIEADSAFAVESGYDFPLAGACITQVDGLRCSVADAQTCIEAGGDLCFREIAPGGEPLAVSSLCWWNVDEGSCAGTPGIWTTVESALPPSDAAACILQVAFL
jgi:cysteine-rich repeat protein